MLEVSQAERDAFEVEAFVAWMAVVDVEVWARGGVSVYDLPDCFYRDWHDEGASPVEAANWALKEAGA